MRGIGKRVLCTDRGIDPIAVDMLCREGFEVVFAEGPKPQKLVLEALLANAPVDAMILRGLPLVNGTLFSAAPTLQMLSCHGAGFDNVDLEMATKLGIVVTTSGGANAPAVAEHAFSMVLMLGRRFLQLDAEIRRGTWATRRYCAPEFSETVLGIVGFGNIGQHTARLARAVGMPVIAVGRRRGRVDSALAEEVSSFEELLKRADIVSLHVPLTLATRHMINRVSLGRMKPGAMLVNTSRGGLVDEDALADALVSGHLGGAALDAFDPEPPIPESNLLRAPHLMMTPHVAALTAPSMERMGAVAALNIIQFFAGHPIPPNLVVNPEALRSNRI